LLDFPAKNTQEILPEKKNELVTISQWVKLQGDLFVCTPMRFSSKLFYGCHMRSRHCLSFGSTWVHPRILVGFMLLQFSV
jgi:hypothetical protein